MRQITPSAEGVSSAMLHNEAAMDVDGNGVARLQQPATGIYGTCGTLYVGTMDELTAHADANGIALPGSDPAVAADLQRQSDQIAATLASPRFANIVRPVPVRPGPMHL